MGLFEKTPSTSKLIEPEEEPNNFIEEYTIAHQNLISLSVQNAIGNLEYTQEGVRSTRKQGLIDFVNSGSSKASGLVKKGLNKASKSLVSNSSALVNRNRYIRVTAKRLYATSEKEVVGKKIIIPKLVLADLDTKTLSKVEESTSYVKAIHGDILLLTSAIASIKPGSSISVINNKILPKIRRIADENTTKVGSKDYTTYVGNVSVSNYRVEISIPNELTDQVSLALVKVKDISKSKSVLPIKPLTLDEVEEISGKIKDIDLDYLKKTLTSSKDLTKVIQKLVDKSEDVNGGTVYLSKLISQITNVLVIGVLDKYTMGLKHVVDYTKKSIGE